MNAEELFSGPPPERDERLEQRARGQRTTLPRMLGQTAAGFANTPTDVLFGLTGLLTGSQTLQNLHKQSEDAINRFFRVENPNWRDNSAEYAARTLGSALFGAPAGLLARVAPGAARLVRTPIGRGVEAITPITLPLTPANVALNAAAGGAIGALVQDAVDIVRAEDAERALFSGPPPGGSSSDASIFDGPPPRRSLARRFVENAPYVVGLALAGTGGYAALRQLRTNREIQRALDAPAVPATPTEPAVPGELINRQAAFGMMRTAQGQDVPIVRQETEAERFTRNILDDTATAQSRIQEAAKRGLLTPDEAAEINAGFAINVQQAPLQDRTNEVIRSGNFDGIRFTPGEVYEIQRRSLSPEVFALYNNTRAALDELDSRAMMASMGRFKQPGEPMPRLLNRHSVEELGRIVEHGKSNPTVAALIRQDLEDNSAMRQIFLREGIFDADTINKMATVHPSWLHTLIPDNTPISRRKMSPNMEPHQVADPILARQNAWQEVISLVLENRQRQQVYKAAEKINQQAGDSLYTLGIGITGPIDYVRKHQQQGTELLPVRINGQTYAVELAPEIAQGVKTYPRATVPFFSALAQLQRNATTGPIAAALGYIQSFISAAYGTTAVMLNRPRGMAAGYIERVTGRNLPIIDPTFIGAVGIAAVRMMIEESARAVSSQIIRSIYLKGPLAAALQRAGVDVSKLQTRLADIYDQGLLAETRRMGSSGTGLTYDPRASEHLRLAQMALTPEYAKTLPIDPRKKGIDAIEEYARFAGRQVTPAAAQRSWRLFTTFLNIISDAPVGAFVMLNRDRVPPQLLHGTARRLQGDPASRGGATWVQQATSVMNYSNITMQATRALARSLREQPIRTVGNIALISGLGAAITVYSAIEADKEEGGTRHMDALINAEPRRLVGGAYVSIPGMAPTEAIRIPMEPVLGAPLGVATALLSAALAGEDRLKLGEQLGAFLEGRPAAAFWQGLSQGINPLNAPPGVSALSQLAGGSDIAELFDVFNPRAVLPPRDIGVRGYANTRLENDPVSRTVDLIMRDLFQVSGEQALLFLRQTGYGNDLPTALAQTMQAGLARNTMLTPLMSYIRGEPMRGMIGEMLAQREPVAERIAQGYLQAMVRPDVVGSGRSVQEVPGTRGGPRPPANVEPLLTEIRALYNALAPFRSERSAAQDAIVRLRSQGADPQETNARVNEYVARIRELNTIMLREYLALERRWQQQTGRDVNLNGFDPLRPIEQFPMR